MPAAKKTAAKPAGPKPVLTIVNQEKDGAQTHWYEVEGKSQSGRGVTTLIGAGLAAPALAKWGRNKVADCALDELDVWQDLAGRSRKIAYDYLREAPDRDRDEAGNRGREVHELAEAINAGEEVDVPDALVNHVDAYLDFLTEWEPEIVMAEVIGGNRKYRYFGKFDLLVRVKGWWPARPDDVALVLMDIKTARSGVFPKDALQLVAYGHFDYVGEPSVIRQTSAKRSYEDLMPDDVVEMPKVDGYAVLHLSSERTYRIVPVKPDRAPRLFATFIHAVRLAEFTGGEFLDRSKWSEDKGWSLDVFESDVIAPNEPF